MENKTTSTEEARYEKRKAVVDAVARGEKPSVVARVFGMPLRTVFHWIAKYRHGGYHALREGKRRGRPRKVTGEVMAWLYNAISLGDPQQFQFDFCLWTLGIVRALLKQEHGIELSKSGVSRLLRHIGLSPQAPKYKSYRQDPRKLRKFLRSTFPGLVREARRTGTIIYYVDEAAVRADEHHGTTWAPVGETPIVFDSGQRFGLKMISAVSPRGDFRFRVFEGRMTSQRFVEFLQQLRRDTGKPVIAIVDNASYHTQGAAKRFQRPTPEGIRVAYLPAYSPELNPDEQVWNHLKRRLGKIFVATQEQMYNEVVTILRSIKHDIGLLLSFFQLKDTRYAANAV